MGLNETPSANRLHIGIFGKVNSGKSSFLNAFTGQDASVVSDVAGTTTDLVTKAMELPIIGPCVFIDTAGFDDTTELGAIRTERTKMAVEKSDVAFDSWNDDFVLEMETEVKYVLVNDYKAFERWLEEMHAKSGACKIEYKKLSESVMLIK